MNMSIVTTAEEWLFGVALQKAVVSAAKLIVSYCVAHGIMVAFQIGNTAIDTGNQAGLVIALNSGLKVLTNFLKVKYPATFDFL
jgi:hypothetical protein